MTETPDAPTKSTEDVFSGDVPDTLARQVLTSLVTEDHPDQQEQPVSEKPSRSTKIASGIYSFSVGFLVTGVIISAILFWIGVAVFVFFKNKNRSA